MNKIHKSTNGSFLAVAVIISIVLGLIIVSMSKIMNTRAHQSVYYLGQKRAYQLAEAGLNDAMAKVTYTSLSTFNTDSDLNSEEVSELDGKYENEAFAVTSSLAGNRPINYYIVTSATASFGGHDFSTKLYSYVQLSNIGEYFAAVKGTLWVSAGVNAAEGRIYAKSLKFEEDPPKVTSILGAEYLATIDPPVDTKGTQDSADDEWANAGTGNNVIINPDPKDPLPPLFTGNDGGPPYNCPRKVQSELVFPQVLDADINFYYNKLGTQKFDLPVASFTGVMSAGAAPTRLICNRVGGIYLDKVTVKGQIIFVAKGNITIQGDLLKAGTLEAEHVANQAVLLTQGDIVILNLNSLPTPMVPTTQTIQAMMIAPNREIFVEEYVSQATHDLLSINFLGSWIISKVAGSPNNFRTVYAANRTYNYDQSLRQHPPPDLPIISRVFYSFEDVTGGGGVYSHN